jgi:hypothetical protein
MSSWLEELNTPVVDLTPVSHPAELAKYFERGMALDRAEANKLLNFLQRFPDPCRGLGMFKSQLEAMLQRRDWVRISISSTGVEELRTTVDTNSPSPT